MPFSYIGIAYLVLCLKQIQLFHCLLTVSAALPRFTHYEFTGNISVTNSSGNGFIGLVAAFQSTGKFIVISWHKEASVYEVAAPLKASAPAGVQIKVHMIEQE